MPRTVNGTGHTDRRLARWHPANEGFHQVLRGPSRRNLDAPRREQGEEVRAVVAPRDLDGSLELAQA